MLQGLVNVLTKWMLTPPSRSEVYRQRYDEFGRWESRVQRYDLFWAFYSNTAYSDVHLWAHQFKTLFALYRYTRGCYNPMFRLGEFWSTAVWGGNLSVDKEGGRLLPSGIPIITDRDEVRVGIDRLWKDSHWQVNKDTVSLLGGVMGDVGIKAEPDNVAGKMRMVPVHPGTVRWVNMDKSSRVVTAYRLREARFDPRYKPEDDRGSPTGDGQRVVQYDEYATLEGTGKDAQCHYQTFLDEAPYAWNGESADWYEPIPFVPFVLHAHSQPVPNYYWGWSEFQAALSKSCEVDDLGSKHHDHIRKASDPKWFLAGATKPKDDLGLGGADPSNRNPQPGRTELPFLYAGMGATASPMVFPLDNQFTSVETQNQLAALEKDYPELCFTALATGDASAKARREARKSAEQKVHRRRAGYDAALTRIQAMCLALGGEYGYPGYEGMSVQRYLDGTLDHGIGERSVFLIDPLDRIEEEAAMYTAWQTAKNAGVPDEVFMRRLDWSDEEIAAFVRARDDEQARAIAHAGALAEATAPPTASPARPGLVA